MSVLPVFELECDHAELGPGLAATVFLGWTGRGCHLGLTDYTEVA